MNLIIGCGAQRRPGWKTLDADPTVGSDYVADLPPLPPEVREVPWDTIEMIHFIEHLYPWDAAELLRQIHACLRPGGTFVLEQPDLRYAARVFAGIEPPVPGTEPGQCDMWAFFGDPTHRNPLYGHRWGYTPESLTDALADAGFLRSRIRRLPALYHVPQRDFRIEAVR